MINGEWRKKENKYRKRERKKKMKQWRKFRQISKGGDQKKRVRERDKDIYKEYMLLAYGGRGV